MSNTKKLKRPLNFQKALLLKALPWCLGAFVCVGGYFTYKNYSAEIQEFIAETIDARLDQVLVSGTVNLSNEELLATFNLRQGDSLVGFNAAHMREQISELNWVKEAVVERELPSTVRLTIYEYTPLARLEEEGDLWVVDVTGHKITQIGSEEFTNLPLLKGEAAAENAAALFGILREKQMKLGEEVVEARYIGERRWDIAFAGGVWVMLPENGEGKALDVLRRLHQTKNVLEMTGGVVDLRLEDRIVLRLPSDKKVKERVL